MEKKEDEGKKSIFGRNKYFFVVTIMLIKKEEISFFFMIYNYFERVEFLFFFPF